jgi:hypothetical protein
MNRATKIHTQEHIHRFSAGGAVAHCNGLCFKAIYQGLQDVLGRPDIRLGRVRIDGVVVQEVARSVEANDLAACAETGVYAHDAALAQRWRQQQLAEIDGKHLNGLFVGAFLR